MSHQETVEDQIDTILDIINVDSGVTYTTSDQTFTRRDLDKGTDL